MTTEEAVKTITSEIKKDAKLRESYIKNISMAFYDECVKNQVDDDLPLPLLKKIAHKAAENFLDNWS